MSTGGGYRDPHSSSGPAGNPAGRANPRPAMAVLFVDPDVQGARRLARTIEGRCAVAVVGSARDAWAAIRAYVPDLIVTELDLPDGSGLELMGALGRAAETRHALRMVVTRRTSVMDKVAAFQAGADDYLVKPVEDALFETHVNLVSRFRRTLR